MDKIQKEQTLLSKKPETSQESNDYKNQTIDQAIKILKENDSISNYNNAKKWKEEIRHSLSLLEENGIISSEKPYPELENLEDVYRLQSIAILAEQVYEKFEYPLKNLTFSITDKCFNLCDFCYAGAGPNGQSVPFEKIDNLDARFLNQAEAVQFAGSGEPFYYQDGNKTLADILDSFYEKGVRNFKILTGGINYHHLEDDSFIKDMARFVAFFHINNDTHLEVGVSFHDARVVDYNAALHYRTILSILTKIPNIKIRLKPMVSNRGREEQKNKLYQILQDIVNKSSNSSLDLKDNHFVFKGVKIEIPSNFFTIFYRLSQRGCPSREIWRPFPIATEKMAKILAIQQKTSFCNVLGQHDLQILSDGKGYACGNLDYQRNIQSQKPSIVGVYDREFEDYWSEYEEYSQRVVDYVKRGMPRFVHEKKNPVNYCQSFGKAQKE